MIIFSQSSYFFLKYLFKEKGVKMNGDEILDEACC